MYLEYVLESRIHDGPVQLGAADSKKFLGS